MASKPTTPEPSSLSLRAAPVKTEKNYPSRKWIAKLALSDVVANLLEIGTAEIRRIKIHNDQPEPFQAGNTNASGATKCGARCRRRIFSMLAWRTRPT